MERLESSETPSAASADRTFGNVPLSAQSAALASAPQSAPPVPEPQSTPPVPEFATTSSNSQDSSGDAAPAAAAPDSRFKGMGCLRCAERPANCVFLPCSHKVWCTECSEQQQQATCPICSTGITQTLKTFHKRL